LSFKPLNKRNTAWGGGQGGNDNIHVVQQHILEDKFTMHFFLTATYLVVPAHFPRVVMELKKTKSN